MIHFYGEIQKLSLSYNQICFLSVLLNLDFYELLTNQKPLGDVVENIGLLLVVNQIIPNIVLPGAVASSVACPLRKQRPRHRSSRPAHSWKNNFPLSLIQEELVVSYWRKNGYLILVNCLREACPGTVWLGN